MDLSFPAFPAEKVSFSQLEAQNQSPSGQSPIMSPPLAGKAKNTEQYREVNFADISGLPLDKPLWKL